MYRVEQTDEFAAWLEALPDARAQLRIAQRIIRLEAGNPGDWKSLGGGLSEMRIDYGPGYRVYYTVRERVIYLLLSGSDKKGQAQAIKRARGLKEQLGK
jgi:putative addiction module killer protein